MRIVKVVAMHPEILNFIPPRPPRLWALWIVCGVGAAGLAVRIGQLWTDGIL
jgi:hypothetical protein